MRVIVAIAVLALFLPQMAQAQDAQAEADKGFITEYLESTFSDVGRDVRITGFTGALSAQAHMDQMTVADAEGVWLTLTDVTLDWSRSALLSGRVEVSELSAERIDIARPPLPADTMPSPEAWAFSLPELPVSVKITTLAARHVSLGQTVIGTPVELSLTGSVSLSDGQGAARIESTRIDGGNGTLRLAGDYSNASRELGLDLSLDEGTDGIAATLIGIPGTPALSLSLGGRGPVDDFTADLRLASDGAERLAGRITLATDTADGATARRFNLDASGDIAPLIAPDYRDFFGPDLSIRASGSRRADGTTEISALDLAAQHLTLTGALLVGADGLPDRAALDMRLASDDGGPVILPLRGEVTQVQSATLALGFDAAVSPDWRLNGAALGLDRPSLAVSSLSLTGSGQVTDAVTGDLSFAANGIALAHAGLAEALGPDLAGRISFSTEGDGLKLPKLHLVGQSFALDADGVLSGVEDAFSFDGTATLDSADLSHLSTLAGRPLSGMAKVGMKGAISPLTGGFDLTANVAAENLTLDQNEIDTLLTGTSRIDLSARRNETGTLIRSLTIQAATLTAKARGLIATEASVLAADFDFTDLSALGPGYGGALSATATLSQKNGADRIIGRATGNNVALGIPELDSLLTGTTRTGFDLTRQNNRITLNALTLDAAALKLAASGHIAEGDTDLAADFGFSDISSLGPGYGGALEASARITSEGSGLRLVADGTGNALRVAGDAANALLAGNSSFAIDATRDGADLRLRKFDLRNPQVTASASGSLTDGKGQIDLTARLADLGLLVPEFPGPLTADGKITSAGKDYGLALNLTGPGSTDARVNGTLAPDLSRADLTLSGSAQAGLANPFIAPRAVQGPLSFDLRLNGPLRLSSLSGELRSSGTRLVDTEAGPSISGISATTTLESGTARVAATGTVNGGGVAEVQGTVDIAPPNNANLSLRLEGARFRDAALYDARISGNLSLRGPLAGGASISGALRIDEAELRLADAATTAAFSFPDLNHINDTPSTRLTRQRAGMDAAAATTRSAATTGPTFPLDVTVTAPGQIFIRGRGLDAELGGNVRLTGTTANVIPSGEFTLIRGRLDLLGKRFTLDEGTAELRGALNPAIRLSASTEADGITSTILIEGDAAQPTISFTSSPQLPEEEVVARLLFGRGLSTLSPLQAAQLASAIATLSGKGGAGIIEKLRQGAGLDDLDITTAEDGTAQLRLGKYLSDNLYTDVEVASDGTSAISLNLDVTESLTVKGTLDSGKGGGIGVFFERDY